jgi:large repetitive protein
LFGSFNGFAQSISGFTPMFCSTNESVRIDGSGFTGVTNVIFFNSKSVRVTPTADNQINVVVPFGATTGPIQVKKGVTVVTSVDDLTIIGREPYVTSFSPISGSESTIVTMNGVHFTGVTNVTFNGTKGMITQLTTDTQIKVSAPANVTTGPISLTRSNLIGTTSSNFFASPMITSFSPPSGRAGTNVVITGKNFLGVTYVKFNSVSNLSYTVDSNTQITVTVAANASTGVINISSPGGQFSTSSNFVVQPSVFSFSPYFGKAGTNVTIVGANLNGTTAVSFNGTAATSISGVTSNQITATVPINATSGPIGVTTTNGNVTTTSNFFLPPSITIFTPTNGAPGTNVTITGVNFTNATDVSFNGVSANFGVLNNGAITSTVPPNATSGRISVTAPGGTSTTVVNFYVRPIVSGFNPSGGVVGSSVTINGSSFTNTSAVHFNGVSATNFTVIDNSQITAIVPVNATTGPISVTAPAGTGVSATNFIVDTLTLSIKLLTNNAVTVSWTTNSTGFSLQATTNLNSSTNWVAVTNVPVVVLGKNTITNSTTNATTLYRLKK